MKFYKGSKYVGIGFGSEALNTFTYRSMIRKNPELYPIGYDGKPFPADLIESVTHIMYVDYNGVERIFGISVNKYEGEPDMNA